MAAELEEKGVSPFPNPPAVFYKLYTDESIKTGVAPKPPRPVRGSYLMFGQPFDVSSLIHVHFKIMLQV